MTADNEGVTTLAAPPTPLPRLASHGLSAPTADDVRAALRTVRPDVWEQLWSQVCGEAGLPRGCHLLGVEELEALTAALATRPGVAGLAGRALSVRVRTYRALAAHAAGRSRGPVDWSRNALELLLRARPSDVDRLADIAALDLFSQASRSKLDASARRMAGRLGTPIGLVSVVLDGAQVFAGQHGLSGWPNEVGGTPIEWSLCARTVRTREPYVVPDAGADLIQRSNPLHIQDGVTGYAGVPLITSRGHVVGAWCGLSNRPVEVGDAQVAEMQTAAQTLVAELEQHRRSSAPER